MRPALRQIEAFVAVARELSFRKAAEATHVTQPALSATIAQLEQQLDVRLFERNRRRVLLTDAGRELLPRAHAALAAADDLADAARVHAAPLTGTLRLGVIPTVAPYVLPAAVPALRARFPALRLLLREDTTARLVQQLDEGLLDLLLLALEAELGDVATLPLYADPFVAAVPAGHRLAKRRTVREADLLDEPVLLLEDGHCLRDQALSICRLAGAREVGDFRATSLLTLTRMVAAGDALTLLPSMAVPVEVHPGDPIVLLPFRAKGPGRTLGLAWRRTSAREPEFTRLAEVLREVAPVPPRRPRKARR